MTDTTGAYDHKESERYRALERQFFTANSGTPPTPEQLDTVKRLRGAILDVAWLIETGLPKSRHKSLAFTLLEDLQMRANRGVFAPQD